MKMSERVPAGPALQRRLEVEEDIGVRHPGIPEHLLDALGHALDAAQQRARLVCIADAVVLERVLCVCVCVYVLMRACQPQLGLCLCSRPVPG